MFSTRLAPTAARRLLTLRSAARATAIQRPSAALSSRPAAALLSSSFPAVRSFSSSAPSPPTPVGGSGGAPPQPHPPAALTEDMALGIQSATRLLLKHGIGHQRLTELAQSKTLGDTDTLVSRWQQMMEAFLGTQVHLLAGMGYEPNERGLAFYNQQLAMLMQGLAPDKQEELRVSSRDTWREVLSTAFAIPMEEIRDRELSIVDARNIMHKVSTKMQEQGILDKVAERCRTVDGGNARNDMAEIQVKHTIVQDVLVNDVYLGGSPTFAEECGFGTGERGYVFMQCVMAEHQSDPLVAQYVSAGMMKVLGAAGLDPATLQAAMQKVAEANQVEEGKSG